ncbi:CPBP family intramembrane glutamic endopeptidase [Chitinibacteraceae bacterium HSL-7]
MVLWWVASVLALAGWRFWWLFALAGGVLLGWQGQLTAEALLPMALLLAAGLGVRSSRQSVRMVGYLVFVGVAATLVLHRWPGFYPERLFAGIRFSEDAVPFSAWLNVDKPLVAFWLLCCWPVVLKPWRQALHAAALCAPLTLAAVLSLALLTGLVAWQPGASVLAHPAGWQWAINMVLLTCLAEELLFRAWMMTGLAPRLGQRTALIASALLFGAAHLAGGWAWGLAATVAGLGYGLAYRRGGLLAAVLVHAAVNLAHAMWFTYPMLA